MNERTFNEIIRTLRQGITINITGTYRSQKYQEDMSRLISLIEIHTHVLVSPSAVEQALSQLGLDPWTLYTDISSGKETEHTLLFEQSLGLPQHSLIHRGIKITGRIIDADTGR